MSQIVSDPRQWNKLSCACGSGVFYCLIHVTGALMICIKCDKKYKLESMGGGVKIANA